MIKRFAALLAASSVRMNTVQCVPVKYNTFVVYNKDRGLSIGSYLQLTCELVKHFHDQNCDFQKDLRLYILENNLPLSRFACEAREDSWIIKLDTRSPNGLNSKLNDYGNLYYSLF